MLTFGHRTGILFIIFWWKGKQKLVSGIFWFDKVRFASLVDAAIEISQSTICCRKSYMQKIKYMEKRCTYITSF
jgi:hypothetical protein